MGDDHRAKAVLIRLATAVALASVIAAAAAEGHDEDRVREALEAGKILPFDKVLQRVGAEHPGYVLGVELEDENGRLVYELRLLAPGGHIEQWRYDARTAEPVDSAGRQQRRSNGNEP